MADSVSLVRRKITNPREALQDETLNSIITLAAIEYGKGNADVSALHIDGVKRLVQLRGGIQKVKSQSPLTARMVAWVSMVVTQTPQFKIQDDRGSDSGIAPIPQWHEASNNPHDLNKPLLDPDIEDVFSRLHNLFDSSKYTLSSTDLHDLTCYVVHRLLHWSPQPQPDDFLRDLSTSGIVRYGMILYMLILQGPTYFSHARLQYAITLKLQAQMEHNWLKMLSNHGSLALWLLSVGMVASEGTPEEQWFIEQTRIAAVALSLNFPDDFELHLREIIWLDSPIAASLFQQKWLNLYVIST
ncbi:hypothetical protein G6514_000967 [Epicoccum nigrum]|nr:hypothetical protein G6514_000967 [Epicoccum nigrum]